MDYENPHSDDILSVTKFTGWIKRVLKEHVSEVWIRGEISNLRRQSSGHVYFSVKDEGAQLSCVLFRGDAARQGLELKDGMQVLVFGGIDVYPPRGGYQLIVRHVLQDGQGRLQQAFEKLKQKLNEEGLFDTARKKPIPALPPVIGVITSPTGAALRDFVSVLRRRNWKGRLIVLPARVQGAEAAAEIVAQIRLVEQLGGVDLLVLTRGGGSLEDLWPFNEEVLVRAVAACKVPVISAVGHEIDFTLSDFAADLRAETPTGAAEYISSSYLASLERVEQLNLSLKQGLDWMLERSTNRMDRLEGRLRALSPQARLEYLSLRLDELAGRLDSVMRERLQEASQKISKLEHALVRNTPEQKFKHAVQSVSFLEQRMHAAVPRLLRRAQDRTAQLEKRLSSASYQRALKRGFSVLRDDQGRIIKNARSLKPGDWLHNELADGEVRSQVWDKQRAVTAPKKKTTTDDSEQGELF